MAERAPPARVRLTATGCAPASRVLPFAGYLCPLSANRYNIRFNAFKVRDIDSNVTLFEVRAPPSTEDDQILSDDLSPEEEAQIRSIRYQFPATVLSLKRIGTTCVDALS